jgi:hypothetical protein
MPERLRVFVILVKAQKSHPMPTFDFMQIMSTTLASGRYRLRPRERSERHSLAHFAPPLQPMRPLGRLGLGGLLQLIQLLRPSL